MADFNSAKEFFDETFEGLDARELRVEGKTFEGCAFVRSQFASAEFVRCRFLDCRFENCDLSNISFKNSSLRDVSFSSNKMIGINWTEASSLSFLKFEDSVLNFGIMSGLELKKMVMTSCVAREMDFTQANLSEANCQLTDFEGARFSNTNLSRSDLRGAKQYAIHPTENIIKQARFSMPEATSLLYQMDIKLD